MPLLGVGYGIKVEAFRASVLASHAFTTSESPIDYDDVTLGATVGADVPLWGP